MNRVLPGFAILLLLATSGLWVMRPERATNRAPAQAALWVSCAHAFRSVVTIAKSPWLAFLRRVPRPRVGGLDADLVNEATARFVSELQGGRALEDIVPETMEETLGLMEAVLVTRGFSQVDYSRLDILKRGKLASLLKQLDKPSRFSLESYENIWAEIFTARLGRWENYKSIFDGDHAKRQSVALLMQREIARLGLVRAGKKYALLENPEGVIRRFKNSKLGRILGTSILNVPVVLGMPPLAFPRFSRLKLPPELADDLLEQGLTDDNLRRVDEFLQGYSAGRFGIGLDVQERYELIRRTYSAGLGAYFLVLAVWETVVRHEEITEEEDEIIDSISEIEDILSKAEILQNQGYEIFSDEVPAANESISRECRDLKDCLESSIGPAPWDKNSQTYKDCREFVDPRNKCTSF